MIGEPEKKNRHGIAPNSCKFKSLASPEIWISKYYRVRYLAVFFPSSLRPSCSPLYSLGRAIARVSIPCRSILARLPLGYLHRMLSMHAGVECWVFGRESGRIHSPSWRVKRGPYETKMANSCSVALLCRLSAAPCILVSGSYRNGPSGFV